ncbi:MAG TPA: ATP-binding protein [Planctomycetota bacterium]|nr:ATP-binding protein [Planctomycetota bacterium]
MTQAEEDNRRHPSPRSAAATESTAPTRSPPEEMQIQFPSSPEYLALLRPLVEWFARKCRFDEKEASRIVLCVVEAVTNVIRHAYGGDAGQRITLQLRELGAGIEVQILDDGKSVAPGTLDKPPCQELTPGGLGVRMMRSCMDHFEYAPRPEGGSRLVLRKLHKTPTNAPGEAGS